MKQNERDNDQLGIILNYCDRLKIAVERFGPSFDIFKKDIPFQDSCSLCLIQIGEAVNRLSGNFKKKYPEIEWDKIYGMRCHLVHGYESFDAEIAWDAIENFIPGLETFCKDKFLK